ncbi:MAG: hypothetical protein NTX56_06895 [Proteobacteria bacterium]|nr:hypothetical protein [Pseudomonadota bacterium]
MWKEKFRLFFALGLLFGVLGLTACGGGGGGGGGAQGSAPLNPAAGGTVTLSLTPNNTATAAVQLTVKATVKDASGTPVKNTVVAFSTGAGSGLTVFSPSSGTAMTGDGTGSTVAGEATIGLSPAPATTGGAATILASVTINGVSVTSDPVAVSVIGGGGSSSGTPSMKLKLDQNELTFGQRVTATVTVTIKNGSSDPTPQPDVVVNFAADPALVTMDPVLGSRKTDAKGEAKIDLSPASLSAAGAGYLTATANSYPTAQAAYSVGAPTVTLGTPVIDPPGDLSASGTASISVDVFVNLPVLNSPPPIPVMVYFSSPCVTEGKASLTPASINTSLLNGKATATVTYRDIGCAGSGSSKPVSIADEITASVAGEKTSAKVRVLASQAANIQFNSLVPETGLLVLKGTGGVNYSEVGNVKFQVVDNSGRPVSNQNVYFSLTTYVGNIQLDGKVLTDLPVVASLCSRPTVPVSLGDYVLQKLTDTDGFVSVNVQSGAVPTPVWVRATTCTPDNTAVSSQSNKMTVTTGLPSQDFFSISSLYWNIEGLNFDNEPAEISVITSDRLGNPVPDGTVINFITEGGQVNPSSCPTEKGTCKVRLLSAESRPANGRVTVLAYALGEESFVDLNNNNLYDPGEPFDDLGNAFIDKNESRSFDSGEQQIIFKSGNGSECTTNSIDAPKKLENAPWADKTCDRVWGQAHVRRQKVIVFSDSVVDAVENVTDKPTVVPLYSNGTSRNTLSMGKKCNKDFILRFMDKNKNPLPVGSSISVDFVSNGLTYTDRFGISENKANIPSLTPSSIPNSIDLGGTEHKLTIQGLRCDDRVPTQVTPAAPLVDPNWTGSFVLQVIAGPNPVSPRWGLPGSTRTSQVTITVVNN